jgi:hypothetical protein
VAHDLVGLSILRLARVRKDVWRENRPSQFRNGRICEATRRLSDPLPHNADIHDRHMTMRQSQPPTGSREPLGPTQCQHVAAVVAGLGPNWSVKLHDDIPGNATIVILPMDLDDPFSLALFVHRAGSCYHLDELCGDAYRKFGEYRGWADVLRAVRGRLLGHRE